jgi:hypothetical protein
VIGTNPPYAGYGSFHTLLGNAHPSSAAVLMMGIGETNLDLTGAGLTGCSLLVDPAFLLFFSAVTDPSGGAAVNVPLLDVPLFLGDLYFQWLYVHPGANAAGLITTRGRRSQVRP